MLQKRGKNCKKALRSLITYSLATYCQNKIYFAWFNLVCKNAVLELWKKISPICFNFEGNNVTFGCYYLRERPNFSIPVEELPNTWVSLCFTLLPSLSWQSWTGFRNTKAYQLQVWQEVMGFPAWVYIVDGGYVGADTLREHTMGVTRLEYTHHKDNHRHKKNKHAHPMTCSPNHIVTHIQ